MAPLKPSAIAGGQSGPFLGLFGDGLSAPADCEAGTAACNGGNGGLIFGNGGNGANGGNGGNGGFLLGSGGNGGAGVNGGNGGRAWLFGSGGDGGNGTNGGNGGRGGLILGNGGSGGDGGEGGVGGAAGRGGVLAGNPGMPGHSGQDIQQVSRYSIVTIKVDAGPQGLTVGPGGNGLYVLSSAGQSVSVINTDPYSPGYNMVTQTYSVAEGIDPIAIAYDSFNNKFLITRSQYVQIYSSDFNLLTDKLALADPLNAVLVLRGYRGRLAVAVGDSQFAVVWADLTHLDPFVNFPIEGPRVFSGGVAELGGGNFITTNDTGSVHGTATIWALKGWGRPTGSVVPIRSIEVGHDPAGVAVNSSSQKAYVANSGDGTVSVINLNTNTVTQTIPVGSDPNGVGVGLDGAIYVLNSGSNTVSVIDPATNKVTTTIPVGKNPIEVAVDRNTGIIYVTNHDDGTVSAIIPSKT